MHKWKYLISGAVLLIIIAGTFFYIKSVAPPGEEWIAWQNEELIASIDRQLSGVKIEQLLDAQKAAVVGKFVSELQLAVSQGELTYEK